MTGTGIAEIVLMMMILRSGVSMIVQTSQDVLHTALENGDEIAEKLAYEIEEEFINRPYTIPLSDDMWGPWFGMDRSLTLRTTTINMALLYSRENVAIIIIDRGANLLLTDQYGNTPLHIAAGQGLNIAVIKLLKKIRMTNPQALDLQNKAGKTPLHFAADYEWEDVIKTLLVGGANPNIADSFGNTPLHLAIQRNLSGQIIIDIIEAMKAKAVDDLGHNEMTNPSGCSSGTMVHNGLHRNPIGQATSEILYLRNNKGQTALLNAVYFRREEISRFLLDLGADPKIADNDGNTALHLAIQHNLSKETVISILEEATPRTADMLSQNRMTHPSESSSGEDRDINCHSRSKIINLRNRKCQTALFLAFTRDRLDIAQILMDRGADPNIPDNRGKYWTPETAPGDTS
uniref:Uncharacterized protein n=1 Tax=Spongospora subterranea TaxID=70186 RepID=A0A0H5QYZ2_9EUKA|eukprot:CRZ06932.1 hypothetical protein [Spongospora subterranea]